MSFAIKRQNGTNVVWHIPYERPIDFNEIEKIIWLEADGDELEKIRHLFSFGSPVTYSVPMPRGNIARWYGSIAKTILFSL